MSDLVIKGATVLDPAMGLNEKKDVAISNGKISEIGSRIAAGSAKQTLDASGMIVSPGFIDIHAHVASGVIRLSIDPEKNCLMKGTTTVADAGSSGELNFGAFNDLIIKTRKIQILTFLNIESLGMIEFIDSSPWNTDQEWGKNLLNSPQSLWFANPENTKKLIRENKKAIIGIKWAHHTPELLELARKTADQAPCKLMAECRYLPASLSQLRSGDILTHVFHYSKHRITKRYDGITEDGKSIHDEVFQATKRGVVLDVGHGKGSFSWKVARLALKEGLAPNTISTDLWTGNVNGPVFDLPTTMEKFLHLGMELEKVVEAVTSKPAAVLGKKGQIGSLSPGNRADVVTFKLLEHRKKVLTDSYGQSEETNREIIPFYVVKDGSLAFKRR